LEAGRANDPNRGGDIINTEAFGLLKCRFRDTSNQIKYSQAYLFNITLAGCPVAPTTVSGDIFVDLTIDGGV